MCIVASAPELIAHTAPLSEKNLEPEEVAELSLVTRNAGFGFMTIFVGDSTEPYIRNVKVPIGVQVNFKHKPNLELVEYSAEDDGI
jgi:hypothetical protein